jgi:hypothetical protein
LPPDQRWAADLYGKEHPESDKLREGLVEQLARLVGAQDRIGLSVDPSPPSVAQRVLHDCLSPAADIDRWISIKEHLPDLAEAAPNVWLDSLDRLLANDEAAALLFEDAGFSSTSPHVSLCLPSNGCAGFPSILRDALKRSSNSASSTRAIIRGQGHHLFSMRRFLLYAGKQYSVPRAVHNPQEISGTPSAAHMAIAGSSVA